MNKYIGCFATSIAGHDHNNIYVIIDADDEYVYFADGKIKKVDNPKKKKLKHVQLIKRTDDTITGRINDNAALTNEDIKARECIKFDARSGMIVGMLSLSNDCSCAKPEYRDWSVNPPHEYKADDHITPLVRDCAKCGWVYYFDAINVGGCGSWCLYPQWPGSSK